MDMNTFGGLLFAAIVIGAILFFWLRPKQAKVATDAVSDFTDKLADKAQDAAADVKQKLKDL